MTVRGRGYRFLTFEDDVIDLTAAEESSRAVVTTVR